MNFKEIGNQLRILVNSVLRKINKRLEEWENKEILPSLEILVKMLVLGGKRVDSESGCSYSIINVSSQAF